MKRKISINWNFQWKSNATRNRKSMCFCAIFYRWYIKSFNDFHANRISTFFFETAIFFRTFFIITFPCFYFSLSFCLLRRLLASFSALSSTLLHLFKTATNARSCNAQWKRKWSANGSEEEKAKRKNMQQQPRHGNKRNQWLNWQNRKILHFTSLAIFLSDSHFYFRSFVCTLDSKCR